MRSNLFTALMGSAIVCASTAAIASPTAFTYQGRLVENGDPADGAYEFQIRLLDNLGTQVGMTQFANAIATEGSFSFEIDFGASAFDGNDRFLEISVRSLVDGGAYIPLTPNQRVTSAPVAQYALSGNEGPQGPQGDQGPQGEPGADGQDGAPGADGNDGADGQQGPEGPQGPQGDPGTQGIQGPAGDSHWGRSGTRTFYTDGYVGIGWSTPDNPLFVRAEADETAIYGLSIQGWGMRGQSTANDGIGVFGQATSVTGNTYGGYFESHSSSGRALYGVVYPTSGTNYAVHGEVHSASGYAGFFEGGRNYFQGRVGVGVLGPSDKLHISVPADENAFRVQHDGLTRIRVNANGGVALGGNSTIVEAGNTYVVNNLGVGENLPTAKLHVDAETGRVPLLVQTNGTNRMHMSASGGITLGGAGAAAAEDVYIVNDLGVGDSSPDAKLDVSGDAGQFAMRVDAQGTDALMINSAATVFVPEKLSIGTFSTHSFDLAVSGSAAKTGGGSWAVFSDQRLKQNITPMLGSLDTISALRPVSFEYTQKDHFSYTPGTQFGFIAQEVQQVIPEWVNTADDGYLYLDQIGYEALIVDAIQELRAEKDEQIQSQKAQISKLQAENDELRHRLERIERMLMLNAN